MRTALTLAMTFAIYAQSSAAPPSASQAPQPTGTTPGACLKEVRDYADKRRADAIATAQAAVRDGGDQAAAVQQRTRSLQQIDADRVAMAQTCAAKFDLKTAPDSALADLVSLYGDARQPELAKAAMDRALAIKTMPDGNRASVLLLAIQSGLAEPKSDERNERLEVLADQLDRLPAAAALAQQWSAHQSLEGYYRYDDLDAGIIKHATWMIEAGSRLTPELRPRYGPVLTSAYVNMAEAWAGQGMNDKAIDLLKRAKTELVDVPNVARSVDPELERLQIVGTVGVPLTAPRWLNMPAGKTTLDLTGKVTLLEFSAHWCVPCKESYPGVNRLRAKYGPQGFQVVIATEFYGYFGLERPLDPDAELARDKTYFAEHGLDVPIAVGNKVSARMVNDKIEYSPEPNPNTTAYKVGGIPQIHLIDKQGRIRLVMVGYDDANEAKLAKMIEGMLKEK